MKKQEMIEALRKFIKQRSGIDFRNYQCGDWKATRDCFMEDYRPILKHGRQARTMLRNVELIDSITAEDLQQASRAYCGRLQFKETDGRVWIDYTTGQYFPTEYRSAVCAVLSRALWDWLRFKCNCETREAIIKSARREFGRGIARDWFN